MARSFHPDDLHSLIAPCGLNCSVCRAYQRKRNPCPGCHNDDSILPVSRSRCAMKKCPEILSSGPHFCFVCKPFPCSDLQKLDKRYRTRYGLSPIDNLLIIREHGKFTFLEREQKKWHCSGCTGLLCMHQDFCPSCGRKREIEKSSVHR